MAKKKQSNKLNLGMKAGILHTIADTIYTGNEGKVREAVANSVDNNANKFIIFIDSKKRTLSLFDNGDGITIDRFKKIFEGLGYGLHKNSPDHLSYFGLGLMSIIKLGCKKKDETDIEKKGKETVFIISKAKEDRGITRVNINAEEIFSKRNEAKAINDIDFISWQQSSLGDRVKQSPINDSAIKKHFRAFPKTFTEIIIKDIDKKDIKKMLESDFKEELSKTLPLKADPNHPFLTQIKDPDAKEWFVKKLNNDNVYCPTIEVFYALKEDTRWKKLKKYFPAFKSRLSFGESDVIYGDEGDYSYFIIYAPEDIEEKKEEHEKGFWVRNKNFLVKKADFLKKPGSRKGIIGQPLENWIYGELFHKNMNTFLDVKRMDYTWDSNEFEKFRSSVKGLVESIDKELREAWELSKEAINGIYKPLHFMGQQKKDNPFYNLNRKFEAMGISHSAQKANEILSELNKVRSLDLEEKERVIDLITSSRKKRIEFAKNDRCVVFVNKDIKSKQDFTRKWNRDERKIEIEISPNLFKPRDVIILGKTFKTIFIKGNSTGERFSFDVNGGKLYINPFHDDLKNYQYTFIEILIAIEIADKKYKSKTEMKDFLIDYFGGAHKSVYGGYFEGLRKK